MNIKETVGPPLVDVQSRQDERGLAIDRVGVSDLRFPIMVMDRATGMQATVAQVALSVSLPHHFKGTHMSRFVEALNQHRGEITMRTLPGLLHDLRTRLDAAEAHVEFTFPYFVERVAPVSGSRAPMDYECTFIGEGTRDADDFVLRVRVPVMTLCPCSKEISDYGAHNQRGYVSVDLRSVRCGGESPELIWIEEVIDIIEGSGSAPVYPLLKRSDERHVTMQAFDNPTFVEDVVRNVATRLTGDPRVAWFRVSAVNQESIHNHSAFAVIEWKRA